MRKHRMRIVSLVLALVMLASASLPAFAQGEDGPGALPTESLSAQGEDGPEVLPTESPSAQGGAEETGAEAEMEEPIPAPFDGDAEDLSEDPEEADLLPETPSENPEELPENSGNPDLAELSGSPENPKGLTPETPSEIPENPTPETPADTEASEAPQTEPDHAEPEEENDAEVSSEPPALAGAEPEAEEAGTEEPVTAEMDLSGRLLQAGGLDVYGNPQRTAVYADYDRQAVIQVLRTGMQQRTSDIDLSAYNVPASEVTSLFADTVNSSPELFYVAAEGNSYSSVSSVVTAVHPAYNALYTQQQTDELNAAVEKALQCVNDQMAPLEKALALHDYLEMHITYDNTRSKHNVYNALVERSCVCQGYALAYNLLLQKCGIPSNYAISNPMNHIWNIVQLDGKWYHVDVTWDDPDMARWVVNHDYFLLSDVGIGRDHHDWTCMKDAISPDFAPDWMVFTEACTDSTYETGSFWLYSETEIIYEGRTAYYIAYQENENRYSGTGYLLYRSPDGTDHIISKLDNWSEVSYHHFRIFSGLTRSGNTLLFNSSTAVYGWEIGSPLDPVVVYTLPDAEGNLYGCHVWEGNLELAVGQNDTKISIKTIPIPTIPTQPDTFTPNTWRKTHRGWRYYDKNGNPLTGSNWINALGHRYVFDDNGILQTGNADGDLLWKGNQYYLNPDKNLDDPSTCYCVTEYTRNRPGVGVTYYNRDGITYRGWVDGGDGKLLYQTVLLGKDGKELKDADGFSTYIYVWGGQQIPAGRDPLDEKKTIPAGNYLFGEDGVLVTGKAGWYTISGSSAIAGEYYLTDANGHCALNTTIWDDAKGHRYLFGADGRKVSAGKDGRDVALTINGQYQTVYLAPDTDYVACSYYRPRKDSKGGDLGLTYYNPDGITYRGWVDGGSGKRLYQTVMNIPGVGELYFIVWHAQYLPAGKDPVTKDPIPAGWYLFDNDGVLITKDGTYTYPDTKNVNHRYQVKGGKIVAIDGKAPTPPKGA